MSEEIDEFPNEPSSSGIEYSAPCDNCGTKLKQVPVKNHKAKCPDCGAENFVPHAD